MKLPEYVILFGHRQQHGKDTCCDFLEKYCDKKEISFFRTYFAKLLKKQVAERYNLDFDKMGDDSYKKWCPPWIEPVIKSYDLSVVSLNHKVSDLKVGEQYWLNGKRVKIIEIDGCWSFTIKVEENRSVRDILIEEGAKCRSIWKDAWAEAAYREIFNSGKDIAFISDFRFPNELDCFNKCLTNFKKDNPSVTGNPKLVTVLVHRENGVFNDDGADGELPDLPKLDSDKNYWDHVILNNIEYGEWKENLRNQLFDIMDNIRG